MNLNRQPTVAQLADVLRRGDDLAGDHVLWVDKSGEVRLSRTSSAQEGNGKFEVAHPDVQMRLDTFLAGNEYVGPEAANDREWVEELFQRLTANWAAAKGKAEIAQLGSF